MNSASRLQDLTKSYECDAVISQTVAGASAIPFIAGTDGSLTLREVELRGREGKLGILCLKRAALEVVAATPL